MPQTPSEIKALLATKGVAPKRSLGQNFLIDQSKIDALLTSADLTPTDLVVEVGPGTGVLTEHLVAIGCRVIACELDDTMADIIRERFPKNVQLVHDDCLENKSNLSAQLNATIDRVLASGQRFKLVANLPYNAASPLMVALAWDPRCAGQHVTIQRDVAQRLRATPGHRDYSELTVMVGATCNVERIATLPPGCFWPAPNVTSEMVAIRPRQSSADRLTDGTRMQLAALTRRLFTKRRKQLRAILGDLDWPDTIAPTARPEALSIDQLIALAEIVSHTTTPKRPAQASDPTAHAKRG